MSTPLELVLLGRGKSNMVRFLNEHPDSFEEAMLLAFSERQPLCWRASWIVGGFIADNDSRVKPHVPKIIDLLPGLEDGHQRELLKILLKMDLEEEHESLLFDLSVDLWEQIRKKPSVRFFAFKCMVKVAEKYPELTNEILILAQPHYINPLSPGIRNSLLKAVKKLESNTY